MQTGGGNLWPPSIPRTVDPQCEDGWILENSTKELLTAIRRCRVKRALDFANHAPTISSKGPLLHRAYSMVKLQREKRLHIHHPADRPSGFRLRLFLKTSDAPSRVLKS